MSSSNQNPTPQGGIVFDRTINIGHILSVIAFIGVSLTQWNIMDKRVVVLEEKSATQRERDIAQDAVSREKFQEVKESIVDLRRAVEKVGDKIGAN